MSARTDPDPDEEMPLACATGKVRLYVEASLPGDGTLLLDADQSHYVANVMRVGPGEAVLLFNGRDGEWRGVIETAAKRKVLVRMDRQIRSQDSVPDLTLLFAPVKRARLDYMVQKAAELGVAAIRPVMTRRTNVARIKDNRLAANLIEAAEQCGRLTVPRLLDPVRLDALLADWPAAHRLLFCDEAGADGSVKPALETLSTLDDAAKAAPWSVLIGPEGGFDAEERSRLHGMDAAHAVSLGPRIMRADTAAMAALSLWQAAIGDWQSPD